VKPPRPLKGGEDRGEGGSFALATCLALLVALFVSLTGARADPPVPPLTGRVMDLAQILDQAEKDRITAELANFEKQKQLQLVVVTLPDLAGYTIEDWGLALGRSWAIGQKGKDNGVILLVAPKDHELRIEVGYGLEGDLPDATANEIIRKDITPYFRKGEMALGIEAGVQAIIKTLGGTVDASVAVPEAQSSSEDDGLLFWVSLIVFFGFVMFRNFGGRRRGFWGGYYGGGGFGRGGGWGGGSSGGGSSGGGFSGGGGSFGGGGASGRW
jgi:uncharacterized protein